MRRPRGVGDAGAMWSRSWPGVVRDVACVTVASLVAVGAPIACDAAASLEFERHYDLSVGDQGEDRFDLPYVPPSCDTAGWAFDSAEIVYLRRRFGEAQVVATPAPGCVRCGPIVVRRYHEPTGELHYRLRVRRRAVSAGCARHDE
jgi:hypothetical protein